MTIYEFNKALTDIEKVIDLDNERYYAYFFHFIISTKISDKSVLLSLNQLIENENKFKKKEWENRIYEFLTGKINEKNYFYLKILIKSY